MRNARPLLAATLAALVFAFAGSADAAKASKSIRELLEIAAGELNIIEKEAANMDMWLTQLAANLDASRFDPSQSSAYRDMKRAADGLGSMAAQVNSIAARCPKDTKKIATDFRALTRRVQNSVRSVASASEVAFAQMGTSRVRSDAAAVRNALGTLGEIEGCQNRTEEDAGDDEEG